jgi:hypothetical protein
MKTYSKTFEKTLKTTLRLFNIDVNIKAVKRLKYPAAVIRVKPYTVWYVKRVFVSKDFAVACAIHEAGHIINMYFGLEEVSLKTFDQTVMSEYKAELFLVRMLKYFDKPFYKRYLEIISDCVKSKKWSKLYPVHFRAMKSILRLESK